MFMVLPQFELTVSLDNDPVTLVGTEDEIMTVVRVLLRNGATHGALELRRQEDAALQQEQAMKS